ncbi:hypothetical protein AAF712_005009 [Marasmius tenuissimus]|uniref:Peptidase A1 domain-containing protein n=1 Tax=Marasmius tenuissimus TaxID=585030 RepID=A0ABR3A1U1_9AGAR
MQLKLSFATLLASVLLSFNPAQDAFVDARPLSKPKGVVTLPITPVESRSNGLHPQIYLQQHINRGNKRLALMSGRSIPSDHELKRSIQKRVASMRPQCCLNKRFNRSGYRVPRSNNHVGLAGGKVQPREEEELSLRKKKKGGKAKAIKAAAAGGVIGGGVGAGVGATAGNGTAGNGTAGNGTAGNSTAGSESQGGAGTGATGGGAATSGSGQLPQGVEAANQPTADNSLGLNIEANDVGFLATIQMGTPPKDFLILMDSGSADLWVGSENCQSVTAGAGAGAGAGTGAGAGAGAGGGAGAGAGDGAGAGAGAGVAGGAGGRGGNGRGARGRRQAAGCGNHNFLGPQSSSSFKDSQQPFQVTYGTGAVAGTIVQDDIVVAGLKLAGHTFGTAQQETQDFSDDSVPFDGLMGLAQSTLSEQKTLTPIEALAKNGLVQDAITSYKIPRAADNKNDGEITFGALDTAKFDQQSLVTLDNVSKQGFWEGAMDTVTVDGQDTQLQGRTAILDTGTTLIIAPPADAAAVHQLIQGAQSDGQGGFVLPCSFNQTVALSFGGKTFEIDPRDMVVGGQPVAQDPQTGDQFCLSGISEGNIGGAQEWLVGDVFLKNAYFSTDVGKNTVSLAKLV